MSELNAFNTTPKLREKYSVDDATVKAMEAASGCNNSTSLSQLKFTIHNRLEELEGEWRALETQANISIYQRYDWIESLISSSLKKGTETLVLVAGQLEGKLVFVLPLVANNGIIRRYRWVGGIHSNYNMALVEREFGNTLTPVDVRELFLKIKDILPGMGYLKLCCQPRQWAHEPNLLLALPHQRSINGAFGNNLDGGFAAVLEAGNGKRKRKKFRAQTRAMEKFGGARLVEATSEKEAQAILQSFYQQKSERLRFKGLRDVFGGKKTRQFLEKMAIGSLQGDEPLLRLYALEVEGEYLAICGGGVIGQHFSAYFTSFSNGRFATLSPGEMLWYMLVERLSEARFKSFDLGCGEERYKRSWCPNQIEMFDVIVPLSPWAYGHVYLHRVALVFKRKTRENPTLWEFVKSVRIGWTKYIGRFIS